MSQYCQFSNICPILAIFCPILGPILAILNKYFKYFQYRRGQKVWANYRFWAGLCLKFLNYSIKYAQILPNFNKKFNIFCHFSLEKLRILWEMPKYLKKYLIMPKNLKKYPLPNFCNLPKHFDLFSSTFFNKCWNNL